jgi:UDP-glucuronate decarboxylase
MMTHPIVQEDLDHIAAALQNDAHAFAGKTVLISGGSGFLGRYLVGTLDRLNKTSLKDNPCRVISVDNMLTGSRHTDHLDTTRIRQIEADIREPLALDEPVHFIIHAAGIAAPVHYKLHPIETIEATFVGAKNLLELARATQAESFLFFSSSEIYGDPDPAHVPTPETYRGNVACIGPRACYDESKRLTETLCHTYATRYGVPVKIVRPFNVYGPGLTPKDHRVVPAFLTSGLSGNTLSVYSTGAQTRSFCYISDGIIGYFKALLSTAQGEAFNIGNPDPELSMQDLAQQIASLIGPEVRVESVAYPDSYPAEEPVRRCPDITKARQVLGFQPTVALPEGLGRTLAWFRDTYGEELRAPQTPSQTP